MPRNDPPHLTVRYSPESRPAVLAVSGELDIGSAPTLREALLGLLQQEDTPEVALDLGAVTFLDSSGLAVLLMAARRWDAEGQRLIVRNPSRVVTRVIDLTGVRAAFVIEEPDNPGPG